MGAKKNYYNTYRQLLFHIFLSALLSLLLNKNIGYAQSDTQPSQPDEPARPDKQSNISPPTYGGLSVGIIKPPTAEEEAALKELAEEIKIYNKNAGQFKEAIKRIIKQEYERRKKEIEERFNKEIDEEERLEEEARKKAIEYFEEFLRKYPDNPDYTPDAMFRLSELYYEQSYIEFLRIYDRYREDYDQYKRGLISEEPSEPKRDYSKTINIYKKLIQQYPDYRNIDGAYYLLGYCLNEMGEFDAAKKVWLSYVCANKFSYNPAQMEAEGEGEVRTEETQPEHPAAQLPSISTTGEIETQRIMLPKLYDLYKDCKPIKENSRFFAETWLRIGEYHFDFDYTRYNLANAISAYKKALEEKDSSFYDLALYKLAWSYWRNGNYLDAIRNFILVVEYADKKATETGKTGSELRPESIQYIALSLWEPDWDGDNAPDETTGFQRLTNPEIIPQDRRWTPEVYNWLGDVYMDDNANMKAIQVFEETLRRWPNAPEAPEIVEKIAKAYQREKMEQKVIETRARLANYGKDSEWWKANMDKPELQEKALFAAEEALKQTALHHHEVAQNLKTVAKTKTDPQQRGELFQRAIEEYNLAAEAYKKYIDAYPNSPDTYDTHFFLAEAYFWSKQYEKAIPVYKEVRDSQMDNKYQEDSAFMVIKALEQLRDEKVKSGQLVVRNDPPEPATGPDGKPQVPTQPLPPVLKQLSEAMEIYIKLFPDDKKNTPAFRYNIAETYYNYGYWDEARKRFAQIYKDFCKTNDISAYSWQNMAAIATALNDLDESERLAKLQKEKQCGISDELTTKMGDTAEKVLISAQARHAMEFFEEAKKTADTKLYEKAAEALESAVTNMPEHEEADKMLWNAAISYERCNKFASALRVTQRLIDEYPQSEFIADALFKLGANAFKSFDYNKALTKFKILADEPRFVDSPHRKPATLNTAILLENKQRYKEAAKYWKRYSQMADDQKESIEAYWKAARCYEKAKMWSDTINEMRNFMNRFSGAKEAARYRVEAAWSIAQAYKKLGKTKSYEKALANVIATFNIERTNIEVGTPPYDYGAEAKFILVEKELPRVEKFKLHTDKEKKVAEDLKKLKEMRDNLISQYAQIVSIPSPQWDVAAQFRIGYLFEIHSKILLEAPIPKSVKKLGPEAEEIYTEKIMSLVTPLEDAAKKEYEKALMLSKAAGIFNKWTERTLERLNAYDPDSYPMYKKGKTKLMNQMSGTSRFDTQTLEKSKEKIEEEKQAEDRKQPENK